MIRVAVVANPDSGRNRRHGPGVGRPAVARAGALHVSIGPGTDLQAAFAEFAAAGVGLVVIDGGDGTVRAALGAAFATPGFAVPPRFAVLASGTTNMIAANFGPRDGRAAAFERLVALAAGDGLDRHTVWRTPIRVAGTQGRAPQYGFFFGTGALAWGTRMTRRRIERGALANAAGSALGVAATAGLLALGIGRAAGIDLAVGYDGGPVASGRRTVFLVTTLERLVAGIHPFWGTGDGPLKVLDIAQPCRRFAWAVPALARGRPWRWMAEAGYRSLRARRVELELAEDALFDGEGFTARPGERVVLDAAPDVGFVRP
ncbi:MAG: diacylglycerol/lipid kinase family protein [Arenimonas sp.]